jgi:hypothetical protein
MPSLEYGAAITDSAMTPATNSFTTRKVVRLEKSR